MINHIIISLEFLFFQDTSFNKCVGQVIVMKNGQKNPQTLIRNGRGKLKDKLRKNLLNVIKNKKKNRIIELIYLDLGDILKKSYEIKKINKYINKKTSQYSEEKNQKNR